MIKYRFEFVIIDSHNIAQEKSLNSDAIAIVASGQINVKIGKELWIIKNSVKYALKQMFCPVSIIDSTGFV